MPRFRLFPLLITTSVFSLFALAQQQATPQQPAPPKVQTARQALIEMITKGGDAQLKHLTVEVQSLLKSSKKPNALAIGMMPPGSGFQTFETGNVLLVHDDSTSHTKYEVHVDSDDLAGDEDSMQLSIHSFRDGKEQDDELGMMSPHFTVSLKLQQNIWRVDKISVGAELPIGDPKFFAEIFLKTADGNATGLSAVSGGLYTSQTPEAPAPAMPPEQTIQMLAAAESVFARQHVETGFTCSLSDLAEWSKMMHVDQQVITGTYDGYRFALSGCEGKPAGSFQITAEPLLARPGVKAFCTDATQNVRADVNGHGATCLATGKMYQPVQDTNESLGLDVHVHDPETNPKP
jgi:hypothetical protein